CFGNGHEASVQHLDLVEDHSTRLYQYLGNDTHLGSRIQLAVDDLVGAAGEAADALAEQNPESAQQPSDLVLDLNPGAHQHLPGDKDGANLVAVAAFDADLFEPACAHDLGKTCSIITIGLNRPHLQSRIGVPCIDADDRQASACQLVPEPDGQWASLEPNPREVRSTDCQAVSNGVRACRHFSLG